MEHNDMGTKKIMMMAKVGMLMGIAGFLMIVMAIMMDFTQFAPLQESYWNIDKATRDAAPTGSQLAQQLVMIKNFPPMLTTMKLGGIGFTLFGILMALLGILMALKQMPMKLGSVIKS